MIPIIAARENAAMWANAGGHNWDFRTGGQMAARWQREIQRLEGANRPAAPKPPGPKAIAHERAKAKARQRYATTANEVIRLLQSGVTTSKAIGERMNKSQRYVAAILGALRKAGKVVAIGPRKCECSYGWGGE